MECYWHLLSILAEQSNCPLWGSPSWNRHGHGYHRLVLTRDRQPLVTFMIKGNSWPFKTVLWWNLCLTKPKIIILCLVGDMKEENLELGETADQRLISKFVWAALVSWHLRRGLVCWGDWKSECLVYLVTTDPLNIPSSQMEGMTLLGQPVCAGGTLYHWGGNTFFGEDDASMQSEHFPSLEEDFWFLNPAIT